MIDPRPRLGSPLRDLRALLSSTAFHGLLLLTASLVAVRVSTPKNPETSPALSASVEKTVDNRIEPRGDGGGAPGEIGGVGQIRGGSIRIQSAAAGDDPTLRSILDPEGSKKTKNDTAAAPPTSGIGLISGPGQGGGGGAGGGSGSGSGTGLGPGTQFFGAKEHAESFVYVIDRSGSMELEGSLQLAKEELVESIDRLPPDTRFAVVLYNLDPETIAGADQKLMPATLENKERTRGRLREIRPYGGTDHIAALHAAFRLAPEVVFFLTDGQRMQPDDIGRLLEMAGRSRVHVIEFGQGPPLGSVGPIEQLAKSSGGASRYINVSALRRARLEKPK
jgi:hypothetical protein